MQGRSVGLEGASDMRVWLLGLGIAATMLACTSVGRPDPGQSGSEYEGPPRMSPEPPGLPMRQHCPCAVLRDQQQLRATITAVEDFSDVGDHRYTLRVDELLASAESGAELALGDAFGGYWSGALPCAGAVAEPLAVGAEVLAFYRRGLQDGALCCEYLGCVDGCRAEHGDTEPDSCEPTCAQQTADGCAQYAHEAQMHGALTLFPWGDEFVVGD